MVVDKIIEWFIAASVSVINLIPPSRLDVTDIAAAWSHVFDLNWFLPISETTSLVLAVLLLGPALLAGTITTWLLVGVLRGGDTKA